ncbi:MAG: 5-formyltetrahydrofolate cyclo-ligase [Spirochaetales bacterium]|jgi:5-formyltetrahydrofolate cyclo-ligase|nr:5-formyltetrahydrofolate cyclo-ligase [Spirochaetales bacterium]
MNAKHTLRSQLRRQARLFSLEEFSEEDEQSCAALLQYSGYTSSERLFAYAPLASEVGITELLQHAITHKSLALPVCTENGNLVFYTVESLDELTAGRYGILEPLKKSIVEPSKKDVMLVPALAYSRIGERLGRGKGYYDRYLASHPEVFSIGICRRYQLLEAIPTDAWDERVKTVLCAGEFY